MYELYKIRSKQFPDFLHTLDVPHFVGQLDLSNDNRIKMYADGQEYVTTTIVSIQETGMGFYVETQHSYYELRRVANP